VPVTALCVAIVFGRVWWGGKVRNPMGREIVSKTDVFAPIVREERFDGEFKIFFY
jgi:hypothetical protein